MRAYWTSLDHIIFFSFSVFGDICRIEYRISSIHQLQKKYYSRQSMPATKKQITHASTSMQILKLLICCIIGCFNLNLGYLSNWLRAPQDRLDLESYMGQENQSFFKLTQLSLTNYGILESWDKMILKIVHIDIYNFYFCIFSCKTLNIYAE